LHGMDILVDVKKITQLSSFSDFDQAFNS